MLFMLDLAIIEGFKITFKLALSLLVDTVKAGD